MPLHPLRSLVRTQRFIACAAAIPSATVVEALVASPFQGLCIDAEHAPLSIDRLESMLRAADLGPTPVLVRVPEVGHYISRVLDLGAAGIIAPRIETAAQAQELVDRCRYAPDGSRGAGVARGQGYGAGLAEYVAHANESIVAAVQIETARGLAAADEILAVHGVDAAVIGPFDLATSMGVPVGSPEHWDAIATIFEAAERHGVVKGAFAFSPEDVERYLELGATLLIAGLDLGWISEGAARLWSEIEAVSASEAVAR